MTPPVALIVAAFSRHLDALAWAEERLPAHFGAIALSSPVFPFHHTAYYARTMGTDLRKRFFVFENLVASEQLAGIKRIAIDLEQELADARRFPETRPLNLDPGILNLGKFMLATTKDQAHRLHLGHGIHGEVTLRFQDGAYHPWPWTYADYREPELLAFLRDVRNDFYKPKLADHMRSGS